MVFYPKKKKVMKTKKVVKKVNIKKSQSLVKAGLGFPLKMLMTHKYFETFDVMNTVGSTGVYQFRANSMFDPNFTGTGHQPYLFDQMAAVYNHFFVISSKITITVSHNATTNTAASACVYLNDDTTVTPTYYGLFEQSKCRFTTLPLGNVDPHKLTCTYSARKIFGPSTLANISLKGNAAADCSESSVFSLCIFPQNVSSTQSYNCTALIEYVAEWVELKDVGQS